LTTLTTRGAIRTVTLLGNHLPRHCGIATFTTDLADALEGADLDCSVVAMNDRGKGYSYPERVELEIAESDLSSYHRAADFLNVNDVDVLSVQHEYGIFGGKAGAHLLSLLRDLRMPIVTTLHTILAEPNAEQRLVMNELCALSERLVVMSAHGADLLSKVHAVPARKIDLIPHGIPALPNATHSKNKLGVQGRPVILTFGLLSPDKGVEHVIDALPEIAKRFPDVVYIVLGATHPHVKESVGEVYRLMLESRGHRLGVDDNLVFHDRFVSQAELVQFLAAADIYITPYLNPEQITSGTLAFAVGSGKSVISTPYRYAKELLAEGRGVLVPWRDSAAIAAEVTSLLGDDARRTELERRAGAFGKSMGWPVVARAYVQTFQRAAVEHRARAKPSTKTAPIGRRRTPLPELNLSHLRAMTDDTGMLQHAAWTVPRYEDGYCVDDNARALMLLTLVEEAKIETSSVVRSLATRYLAFVRHARPQADGRFRNFMSHARVWNVEHGSEDSHGRALWSLGTVVARCPDPGRCALADDLFRAGLLAPATFTSPRAWAYTLLGIDEYLRAKPGHDGAIALRDKLAERLVDVFNRASSDDWPWFEDRLTYANARLPQALMRAGDAMNRDDMKAIGVRSLDWLRSTQRTADGSFAPIGTDGFFVRGGEKAEFDHQPVEACGMVSACLEAFRLTGQTQWAESARTAFEWFLGRNHLAQWVYDASTGGCRDGLHRERPNENQGAEATLSFLTALMELRQAEAAVDSQPRLA
jgi:glycosyltransferase involved in cell wall biosynthesis